MSNLAVFWIGCVIGLVTSTVLWAAIYVWLIFRWAKSNDMWESTCDQILAKWKESIDRHGESAPYEVPSSDVKYH